MGNVFDWVLTSMPLHMFLWTCMGSMAVEVLTAYRSLQTSSMPRHYRKLTFWVVRVLLAIIGGGMTVAYDIHQPLLALNLGAATPMMLDTLTGTNKNLSG